MYNIPLSLLNLSVPNMVFETSEGSIIRPITDHPPIIQNTLWGAFATMNILNPGSSFAPVAQINGIKNLPADGQMQMELMAEYIISLFNQGIVLLALQEVPPPNSLNAAYLTNKLKKSKLKIETFNSHWLQTGLHRFGTSLLYKSEQLTLLKPAQTTLENRIAVFQMSSKEGFSLSIANVHGDFTKQEKTEAFIKQFAGICVGDSNINTTALSPDLDNNNLQSIVVPQVEIEGHQCRFDTVDFFQDKLSRAVDPFFLPNTAHIVKL